VKIRECLSFDDVLLVPKFSVLRSRKEADLWTEFMEGCNLEIPIISSPMDTVTGAEMMHAMDKNGGMGVVHRYNAIEEQAAIVTELSEAGISPIAAAIGATGDFLERARVLVKRGAGVLCIDIAHGHHLLLRNALGVLRNEFGSDVHLMAGNVATLAAFNDVSDWGADSIRVGVGGGSCCSTRIATGHGVPTFQSILDCSQSDRDALIIADGGIKNSGDIVKALGAGADFVMLGSILAGTDEAPGDVTTNVSGEKYKYFRGMASRKAQVEWRGWSSTPEGVSTMIPYKGPVEDILTDLRGGIASGISYSGAFGLKDFRLNVEFIKQTSAGRSESRAHILGGG
jgi:IMP dehydrogenase